MHHSLLELIKCPVCNSTSFTLQTWGSGGDDVVEGAASCGGCATWFRIEDGILDLLPLDLRRWDLYERFAGKHGLTLKKDVSSPERAKNEQIVFFAEDSKVYEAEVSKSPCFMAIDDVTVAGWLNRQRDRACRRLLDLGCGTGRQTLRAAEAGFNVVGADISEEMLIVARALLSEKNVLKNADLVVTDAERFPVRDEVFDACLSIGTLHHVPHPDLLIREACRAISVGGALLFYDPHNSPVRFAFDFLMRIWKLYDEKASDDPLMTESDMKKWLEARGAECASRMTVYLPPHIFYLLKRDTNARLLAATDRFFNAIPGIRKCGGILVTEGTKKKQ